MAIQKRQSNLYAGEDWKMIYEAFRKINLTAYDFDTIRSSIVSYLQSKYPDSFSDWIDNDEFLFILDTISFLGQNLAFRMDLNSRDNFLDTAERRSSVLKLAKMISYSPRRSYCSRGLVKITEIKTNQDIYNSLGKSLKNETIKWNDPYNKDWYDNFLLVMNSVLISSNQFGEPIKSITDDNINKEIYRINSIPFQNITFPFNANINGDNMKFEIVNPDFNDLGIVIERTPDPTAQHHIIYKNDGNGFSSPNTGFFMYFKEGVLGREDYVYQNPEENRIQHLSKSNVNEMDVWVQEITNDGYIRQSWTKVPSIESIPYNSINRKVKNIYSVITYDNDKVAIKFPDSKSSNVPRGIYRFWTRTSNGKAYTIKPSEIQNKMIKIGYRTKDQTNFESSVLTIKFSLQTEIKNSQTKESLNQIKERAPLNFYTQNRFITGEDYNIAPLSLGNAVLKSKAINRLYSGQSRFIDINDATNKYQNVDVFGDDGAIYRDTENAGLSTSIKLPTVKTNKSIVIDDIQPLIDDISVVQKYQEYPENTVKVTTNQIWHKEYNSAYGNGIYGSLIEMEKAITYPIGTIFKFTDPTTGNVVDYTSVMNIIDDKLILSKPIGDKWILIEYIKPFNTKFSKSEVQQISSVLDNKNDFVIAYNGTTQSWIALIGKYDDVFIYNSQKHYTYIVCNYNTDSWSFKSYGTNYIFIGGSKVKFYFVDKKNISTISTGNVENDTINILSNNINPESSTGYLDDMKFNIIKPIIQENGYMDGSRAIISSSFIDDNGLPLNPNIFQSIVPEFKNPTDAEKYANPIILKTNADFTIEYIPFDKKYMCMYNSSWNYTVSDANLETTAYKKSTLLRNIDVTVNNISGLYNKELGYIVYFKYDGKDFFIKQNVSNNNDRLNSLLPNLSEPNDTIAMTVELALYRAIENDHKDEDVPIEKKLKYYGYEDVTYEYRIENNSRNNIKFHWKHYAPSDNRIDPCKTNIIDMYVLTNNYMRDINLWKKRNDGTEFPKPPSTIELKDMFAELEKKNVISDSMIWHSARFLPLFGKHAPDDLKAQFKVIRTPNAKLSDDEIRQRIIDLINTFFNVAYWDFGESFYYTELSTYIHQELATEVASVVIVPLNPTSKFGELFEIPSEPDQLFINTATVEDVSIIKSLARSNINIGY